MPKKPPKNGFFYFMLSYKRRAEHEGRVFAGGLPEVAAAASPEWKTLPQFRKDYYNEMAKERRNDPRPNLPKRDERRFNSQGVSFAEIKMEKAKAEERLKQEKDYISKFVYQMNLNDLRDKLLYLIHVNIFCKTDKDVYYPAEIGMVKFSLRGGVKAAFHRYIDPGEIAPGYSYEVKEHSERTHRLTPHFVRSVDGTSDFSRLYGEICEFLSEDEVKNDNGTLPPLFTMYENIFLNSSLDAVKGTFKSLWAHIHPSHDQDDNSYESVFKILPLPDMFFHLKNRCMAVTNPNTVAFPNDVLAKAQLQKDTYHYELSTACRFHRDEDIIAHCSQSFVLRWMYIIRDHCADLIGVDLFPKYIAPKSEVKEEKIDVDDDYDTESTAGSQYSSKYSEASSDYPKWSSRIKREVTTSRCKAEPDRDRYASSGRDVKRERDESADDHRASSSRHVKRERDDDGDSGDSAVKREKKTDFPVFRTTIVPVKSEKSSAEDASVKKEPVARVKEERKGNPFIASLFMHELDMCSDSTPAKREIKQEKTGDVIKRELGSKVETSAEVKREQGAAGGEGVNPVKVEKGVNVKEERATVVKEERGATVVKDENGATVVKEERSAGSVEEVAAPANAENGAAAVKEEYLKMDPATGRLKVETIDLSYSDW